MAKPPCSNKDGNEAYLSVVNLDNGEVFTPCLECCAGFALAMAGAFTVGLTPDEAAAYGEGFDLIATNDTRAPSAPQPARRKTGKKAAAGLVADDQGDQAAGQPPAPVVPSAQVVASGSEMAAGMLVALEPPCPQCNGIAGTGDAEKLVCNDCGHVIATVQGMANSEPA